MSMSSNGRIGNYVFLAVVAGIVAFLTVGGFTPGYVPTCDHQEMRPGDSCIGSGGGSYDQMVSDHYRNDHIGFAISFPLMILFIALAIEERRRNRRAQRASLPRPVGTGFADPRRVATNARQGTPETPWWSDRPASAKRRDPARTRRWRRSGR